MSTISKIFSSHVDAAIVDINAIHANEIFMLQKTIADLKDQVYDLEIKAARYEVYEEDEGYETPEEDPTPDEHALTEDQVLSIMRENGVPERPCISGWYSFWYNGKRLTLRANRAAYARSRNIQKRNTADLVWMGTRKSDEDIFIQSGVPFSLHDSISTGSSGHIYTTEPIYESTLMRIIAEFKN